MFKCILFIDYLMISSCFQTVLVKQSVTLETKVTGKPEPDIKWFR